eukprot:5353833-Prymnesium_polylepis.1
MAQHERRQLAALRRRGVHVIPEVAVGAAVVDDVFAYLQLRERPHLRPDVDARRDAGQPRHPALDALLGYDAAGLVLLAHRPSPHAARQRDVVVVGHDRHHCGDARLRDVRGADQLHHGEASPRIEGATIHRLRRVDDLAQLRELGAALLLHVLQLRLERHDVHRHARHLHAHLLQQAEHVLAPVLSDDGFEVRDLYTGRIRGRGGATE